MNPTRLAHAVNVDRPTWLPPPTQACWFPRERTLPALFADVAVGGTVWLGFSNTAFRDLSLNWIGHIYRLRKERQLVIAALDRKFSATLLEEGVPHFDYDWGVLTDMRSNVSGFRRLGALKADLVLKVKGMVAAVVVTRARPTSCSR